MRLTTRGRYAVTAMLDLALHSTKGPVTLAPDKAAFAWAIVHGLASLALDSQLCGPDPAHRAPRAADLMQAFATFMRPGIEG